ncbi:hypothetical protein DFJ58DRAFT_813469 [Suillus subalutaceus]|uniref:uncharacterized protein n=1 Tax=Suillus subalutaceus TaxID=48586 RepID=UPI001B86E0F9|nr:uncharacterized protein DFJ58DRAFT_813469 [Suillus subalutaceus]KAG1838630.1 hypothetical protein DFJ58DRAFT_813469 [Suillus subalutaceus]
MQWNDTIAWRRAGSCLLVVGISPLVRGRSLSPSTCLCGFTLGVNFSHAQQPRGLLYSDERPLAVPTAQHSSMHP